MDPSRRPLLTPLAVRADKADERVTAHRAEAELAAEIERAEEANSPRAAPGRLGRFVSRLRARLGR